MMSNDPGALFLQEAQELLETLEQALLDLENDPGEQDLIDQAFRALHTIKGSGAMFGFEAVAAFTHHVETAFDQLRKGKVVPSAGLIAVALAAKDHLRRLFDQPDSVDPAAGDLILADLQGITASEPVAAAPASPESSGRAEGVRRWRVRFRLGPMAMAQGTNPLLLLDELRDLGPAVIVALAESVPTLDALDPTECHLAWDVIVETGQGRDAIEAVFMFVIEDMQLDITEVPAERRRIGEILLDRGDVDADDLNAALSRQEPVGKLLVKAGALSEEKLQAALVEQTSAKSSNPGQSAGSVRVPAERLDELMERVGELVIAQARLRQIALSSQDAQVKSVAEEIERLALELRDTTMGIRMVPIGALFGRFRRVVHDLSRDLGKTVRLTTAGEETELDKTVIERLNEPLVHLIRNAIDHGLETPEQRAEAGKAAAGEIHLAARHVGTRVHISIRDDGRGLDRARIRARAEEQGLVPTGAKLADSELWQIIFQPGFSTAAAITSISGRGVGMDVVKRTIESLGGSIDITSSPGQGSEISLRLPLTLAIIDGLLVRVGQGRYVIPLTAVEECVELTAAEDAKSRSRRFLSIRGDLVPFLRLRELFGVTVPPDPYQKIVIVACEDQRIGLVVDQVIGDHQTVIKSLSKLHADVQTFSGATILGDGTVALIFDIAHLVGFAEAQETRMKQVG